MANQVMTTKGLEALKPRDKQFEVSVGGVKALRLRISPGGSKSFYLVNYFQCRRVRIKLGRFPDLNLAQARSKARKALVDMEAGIDPTAQKREQRAGVHSFEYLVREFIAKYASVHNKQWRETERIFERSFLPHWASRPFADIDKPDVVFLLDGLVRQKGPSAANHAFRALRKLYNWAIERGMLQVSPCLGLKEPARNVERDRVLTDGELARIWMGAEALGYPFGAIAKLMVLTGKRRGEAAGIAWAHLDFGERIWTMPADQAKNNELHILPIMPMVSSVLRSVPRLTGGLVFPSQRSSSTNPVSGFGRAKARLDSLSGVENWRLHDIRRTVATGLSRLGVQPHVTERVLNHMTGSLSPVAKIYNRHHYLAEMRDALEKWERHIEGLLTRTESSHSA